MTRPTKEQVEQAREQVRAKGGWAAMTLEAEVRALRFENENLGSIVDDREQLAEVERLQRAAVPGNGPEMLRMQVALKRSEAEVERLKADHLAELTALNESLKALENATSIVAAIQLRELREAAEAFRDIAVSHTPKLAKTASFAQLEAVLAKAGG